MNLFELLIFLMIILGPAILQWMKENQKRKQQANTDYVDIEEYYDDEAEYANYDLATGQPTASNDPLADALREIREALGQATPPLQSTPPPVPPPVAPQPVAHRAEANIPVRSRHGDVLIREREVDVPDSEELVLFRDRSAEDLSQRRADYVRPDVVIHQRAALREITDPIKPVQRTRKLSPYVADLLKADGAKRAIVLTEVFGPPPSKRPRSLR